MKSPAWGHGADPLGAEGKRRGYGAEVGAA